MDIHQRMVFLMEKTVKPYFKAMILSLKNYENILKFNFLIPPPPRATPIRHTGCLGKHF